MLQCRLVEFADPPMWPDHKRQRKRIPVAIRVCRFMQRRIRMQCAPVFAVIGGDIGAVGANCDPGFTGGVIGDGGAVTVWRGCGRLAFEMDENSFEM